MTAFNKVKMCKDKLKGSELFLFERKQGEYATEVYKITLCSEGQKRDLMANKGPKASRVFFPKNSLCSVYSACRTHCHNSLQNRRCIFTPYWFGGEGKKEVKGRETYCVGELILTPKQKRRS